MHSVDGPVGPDDYKKRQEAIKKKISDAAKSSGSEILKQQAKKEKRDDPKVQDLCQMARMLLDEGIDMYRSGDMTFGEMADDLHKSLMAIAGRDKRKNPPDESEDE